jgi:hypothetical protein
MAYANLHAEERVRHARVSKDGERLSTLERTFIRGR